VLVLLAHSLCERCFPDEPSYGPAYVRVLIELLVRHAGFQRQPLFEPAQEAGIAIASRTVLDRLPCQPGDLWYAARREQTQVPPPISRARPAGAAKTGRANAAIPAPGIQAPASPSRDSQRKRLYAWERAHLAFNHDLTLEQCQALVDRVCQAYGQQPAIVKHGGERGYATGDVQTIVLPQWAWSTGVVLHETAHTLACRLDHREGHGPLFLRIYLELLRRFGGCDEEALLASAAAERLQVGDVALLARLDCRPGDPWALPDPACESTALKWNVVLKTLLANLIRCFSAAAGTLRCRFRRPLNGPR
jgi:hypothetical protein